VLTILYLQSKKKLPKELEDARWFTKTEVSSAILESASNKIGSLKLPPPYAIAHHLLKDWVNGEPVIFNINNIGDITSAKI